MSHIFNPKHFKKLESKERYVLLPPELIIEHLGLQPAWTVADVGCGIGYFSFPFAEHVKKVIGIDISDVMMEEFNKRNSYSNVQGRLGDFSDLLDHASVDVFFTATVIHELNDLPSFTKAAYQVVKSGGKLAYLDFMKKDTTAGPPVSKRIASETVVSLFQEIGLSNITTSKINDVFYLVVGEK